MIDFHSHLLPGLDDGSHDLAMTEAMLLEASAQGITQIVATPHFYADKMQMSSFLDHRRSAYEKISSLAETKNIQLYLAAEVAFFDHMGIADEIEKLCIEGTRVLLIEMPFRSWTDQDLRNIDLLLRRDFEIVIVHLERFLSFPSNRKMIGKLLHMPVVVQINADSLLSLRSRLTSISLIKNCSDLLLGSDAHNISTRANHLLQARACLEKKLGYQKLAEIDDLGQTLLER